METDKIEFFYSLFIHALLGITRLYIHYTADELEDIFTNEIKLSKEKSKRIAEHLILSAKFFQDESITVIKTQPMDNLD